MTRRPVGALLALLLLISGLLLAGTGTASAHEERPATFPDGSGERPAYLGLDNPRHRVVCKDSSPRRIAAMKRGPLKTRNQELLQECKFRSIQSAINTITEPNTSIYILPGVYAERKWANKERSEYCSNLETSSDNPLEEVDYIGSVPDPSAEDDEEPSDPVALAYSDQKRCAHNLNLITIFGDGTPKDDSIKCDSEFCGTQLVGTGANRKSVIIDNKFAKLNAIRADRAGGVYMRNFTVQQAEFNAVYVMETDGFVMDRLIARGNDEYGILAFASDHGLIQRSNAYYNGDSGIYPGSASDLNGDNTDFEANRYAIVIRRNRSHHNTLGYSGTAGNSVLSYKNRFYRNAAGIATDSLFPGHPGLPQDHARWTNNWIYANNINYYERHVFTGDCEKPIEERGYLQGTVCPVVPVPVGTGVLVAGGNYNSTDDNYIFNNWRYGTMHFWVPAALRDEFDPAKQRDTSHYNRTFGNVFGIKPNGDIAHNGMDSWWDDEGDGNCWTDNESSREGGFTHNFAPNAGDPLACPEGSVDNPLGDVKLAGFVSCAAYDRNDPDFRDPPECNWFDSPPKPTDEYQGDPMVPGPQRTQSSLSSDEELSGALGLLAVIPIFGLGAVLRRRNRPTQKGSAHRRG
jgi:hypothetical protein